MKNYIDPKPTSRKPAFKKPARKQWPVKPKMDEKRPLSWSAISSFEYDPEQWYEKYVLGKKSEATNEMLFGSEIGRRIASDPDFLPHLQRYEIYEYELRGSFAGIPLIGFIDGFTKRDLHSTLGEYKTGRKPWTQERADLHGQIDMYLLLLLQMEGIKPEHVSCEIHWMPTQQDGDFKVSFIDEKMIHTFPTNRTTKQILQFGTRIKSAYRDMHKYTRNHSA